MEGGRRKVQSVPRTLEARIASLHGCVWLGRGVRRVVVGAMKLEVARRVGVERPDYQCALPGLTNRHNMSDPGGGNDSIYCKSTGWAILKL